MGINSNSKRAVENIRTYIMNHYVGSSYDWEDVFSFEDVAHSVMSAFFLEKGFVCYRYATIQQCFVSWCAGLPSILDTCYFYNRSAVDDLGDILDETVGERSKYTESDAEQMLSKLIWREIYKACHYEVKNFRTEC